MAEEGEGVKAEEWLFPPWTYSISLVLVLVSLVCSVGSWIFVFYYRKKRIVSIGQPEFLYNLCLGSLLILISMVIWLSVTFFEDRNEAIPVDSKTGTILDVCCNFAGWLSYIGFAVVYTALLCKIYRIMKVTEQPLRRGLKILPRHVIWPLVLVVSLMVFLLAAWSATGTSKFKTAKNPYTNKSIGGYCEINPRGAETPSKQFLIALIVLLSTVQLVLPILAFKIRKINQELGDSKRILWVSLTQVITFVVLVPISFFAGDKVVLVRAIQYCMYSILPVGIMIFPRMYYVWYEHQHDRLPENVVMIGGGTTTVRGVNPGVGNKNDGNGNDEDKKNDYNASMTTTTTAATTTTRSSTMEC